MNRIIFSDLLASVRKKITPLSLFYKKTKEMTASAVIAGAIAVTISGCTNNVMIDDIQKLVADSVAIDKQTITGVALSSPAAGQLTISWSVTSAATGYFIYYNTAPGTCSSGLRLSASASPYTVSGLTSGATYYVCVSGYNDSDPANFLVSKISGEVSLAIN